MDKKASLRKFSEDVISEVRFSDLYEGLYFFQPSSRLIQSHSVLKE